MARILLIDDEDVVLEVLGAAIRRGGFEVETAKDAAAARVALERDGWAAVLVDKNLPDGFGIEIIRESKPQHPFTQFLVITGYASLESAVQAIEAGAYDYLIKPFDDLKDVIAKVTRAVDKSELEQENTALTNEVMGRNRQLQKTVGEITRLRSLVIDDAELAAVRQAVWDVGREVAAARDPSGMLADLVEMAHPGPMHKRATALDGLVGAAIEAVSPTAAHRKVRMSLRASERVRIDLDLDRMGPVLRHVLRRAVEGSPMGTEVAVELRDRGGHAELLVQDTGDPVPLHSPPRAGSVGVRLCRAIVEDHGGKLAIEPRPEGGMITRLTLPR
jgi:ActR/RegA family two-component response regulator